MRSKVKLGEAFRYFLLLIGTVTVFFPLYLTISSSFKTGSEMFSDFFGLPATLNWSNYLDVLHAPDYLMAFGNSVLITSVSVGFMILLLPMSSYAIARRMKNSKGYIFLYFFIVAGIFVPFQVKMLPMVKLMSALGMMNQLGAILIYLATATCEGVFLMVGYLQAIPTDLEEAAYIDGASTNKMFCQIIRPMMAPIISTVVIKNSLWVWNDYFMPSLLLNQSKAAQTLTLYQYSFKLENSTNYTIIFAVVTLSILPITLCYLVFQKKIVSGLMDGAIKG